VTEEELTELRAKVPNIAIRARLIDEITRLRKIEAVASAWNYGSIDTDTARDQLAELYLEGTLQ